MEDGGAEGTRTPDIHTASVVFSQLNYSPTLFQGVLYHLGLMYTSDNSLTTS